MLGVWMRRWRRSPLLTAQFAVTIVVGMGAATALVSLMLALGYQPLPYREPNQLVEVWETVEPSANRAAISGPDLTDFADASHNIFAAFGAFSPPFPRWLIDRNGATEIQACYTQASVLNDLGIRPALGRGALPDDAPLGSATAPAWISYHFWQTRYSGSPSVIGATFGMASSAAGHDQSSMQIVGVLPRGVHLPNPFFDDATDVWYLMERDISVRPRQGDMFVGLGRLRPRVSVAQAQAALSVVSEHLGQRFSFDRHKRPVVQTLEEILQGPVRQTTGLLALGVALVFLVGCVNLAILMGAEGRRRRREIAIRAVLGASRWRLWSEVAAEKFLLTLISLGLGAAFASMLLRVLTVLVPDAGLGPPLEHPPPLNLAVLFVFAAFALTASLIWSGLLVAAANGSGASRALASAGGGTGYTGLSDSSRWAGRWRLILLAAQAGTGICLLAAAALTARTYAALSVANLGPAPNRTVLMHVCPPDDNRITDAQRDDFHHQVLSRLERLPGTQAIAKTDLFPPPGSPEPFVKQGDAADVVRDASYPIAVSTGYFRTLGIPILFGRSFDDADNVTGERVAIISLDMAEQNWTSPEQAVGSQFAFGEKFDKPRKIVGVAANFTGYWSQKPFPTVYLPEVDSSQWCGYVILRTSDSPRTVVALAPQALAGMAIPATISNVSTMQERWRARLTRPLARIAGMLLLALLGLGLSVQGVYAVAAAAVAARRHELAVRSALGAPPGRLVWNVTREMLIAVVAGSGLGVAASLEMHPLLKQWLGPTAVWRTEPIAVAVVLLTLAAAVGCYVPARAAARANPAEVLRQG